jgi:hypothetical protein
MTEMKASPLSQAEGHEGVAIVVIVKAQYGVPVDDLLDLVAPECFPEVW